ncbi:phosphotransferase [Pseudanabaena sp. PCC 6802]|uniref:phosphotransferase n=1 Tax=Pseudanabaena sp. PCC 6802 TaxID=118173 RepID=UPI00034BFE98|nr:phosphotransferase [Pseudanabaena sp. PCC 6802]
MTFVLSADNVFNYLQEHDLCTREEAENSHIEVKYAKNYNLLIGLPGDRKLLVKQERYNSEGKTAGEFLTEWRTRELLQTIPELNMLCPLLPEILHFGEAESILVFNYLTDCRDLSGFYGLKNGFPPAIATVIGSALGQIHRSTFKGEQYQEFISKHNQSVPKENFAKFSRSMSRITPEVFGRVPADAIKFFTLYQRYDSLARAISELDNAFQPSCLTHNDLKLNNILLHDRWETYVASAATASKSIRIIDWERCGWGDPAFDLGLTISSYMQIWLGNLVVNNSMDIQESLRIAMIPLESIQPSIAALMRAYLSVFPEIIEYRPDFLVKVVQFTGFSFIQQIQAMIQYQKYFGNTSICLLQVAKSLLCRPQESITTVFGTVPEQLMPLIPLAA